MYIDAYDFSYFMAWPLFLAASGINCLFLSEPCVCRCCCPCIYFYDPKCWHVEPEPEPASIPSNTITNINVIYVLDTFGGKRRLDLGGMRERRRGPLEWCKKKIYPSSGRERNSVMVSDTKTAQNRGFVKRKGKRKRKGKGNRKGNQQLHVHLKRTQPETQSGYIQDAHSISACPKPSVFESLSPSVYKCCGGVR